MADDNNDDYEEEYWAEFLGTSINDDLEDLPQFALVSSICRLRNEADLSDATLISSDGERFPVHKLVLASRSDYFKTLFYGKFRTADVVINVPFDGSVLEAILSFCYTDAFNDITAGLTKENATEKGHQLVCLTSAAQYFVLEGMIRRLWVWSLRIMFKQRGCIRSIRNHALEQNVEEIATLAKHALGMTQKQAENSCFTRESSGIDDGVYSRQQADYGGQGVYVLLGCSDKRVNGEYHAPWGHSAEATMFENNDGLLLERIRMDELGTLGSRIVVKEASGKNLFQSCFMLFPPRDLLPKQWEACSSEGKQMVPPISFLFRKAVWHIQDEDWLDQPW